MNERIKELVEQAGFIRFSPDEDYNTPIDWSCDYTQELEKFAQLIINECSTLAYDGPDGILNHFGINGE